MYSTLITSFLLAIVVTLFSILYYRVRQTYRFWQKNGIKFEPPTFPFGNMIETFDAKQHFGYIMEKFYTKSKELSAGDGFYGLFFFTKLCMLVTSTEFAKEVLTKDFQYFTDRGVYSNEKTDPLSANLFFINGAKWKNLREKIRPTFTSYRLKMMFPTILEVGKRLKTYLKPIADEDGVLEVRDILARFTTDSIASCAFGVDCDSIENPKTAFRQVGIKMFAFSKVHAMKMFFSFVFPRQAKALGMRIFHVENTRYFTKLIRETIEERNRSGTTRNDFLQLLLQLHKDGRLDDDGEKISDNLTLEEIAAQSFIFFFAGFETSSSTLSLVLHQLAVNTECQEKARAEIVEVLEKYDGEVTYESLTKITYLEQVINETQRIYPTVATLHRITTNDYTLPSGVVIPKGVQCVIPTLAFHRDPEIFPDPMNFDPDRFTAENKAKRHPFSFLPFGEGPRICIGFRFGMIQIKLCLALLLQTYRFEVCDRTENPILIDPVALTHQPKNGIWLKITKV